MGSLFFSSLMSSQMKVERKRDDNSYGRGKSGKIRGKEKYLVDGELIHMGTVKVSLNYDDGALIVFLHSAPDLAGKQSQDSYANVFLIEDDNEGDSSSSSS